MHEASLAGGVLRLAEDAAQREGFQRVSLMRIAAGALAGVEVRALRFALEALAPGTCLEDACFEFEEPMGQAWCLGCGKTVEIRQRGDACPCCGSHHVQATGGTELRVIEMLVND